MDSQISQTESTLASQCPTDWLYFEHSKPTTKSLRTQHLPHEGRMRYHQNTLHHYIGHLHRLTTTVIAQYTLFREVPPLKPSQPHKQFLPNLTIPSTYQVNNFFWDQGTADATAQYLLYIVGF